MARARAPARGCPQRGARRPRRRRVRPARVLRLRPRHPEHRPPRRRRAPLRALPHHRALLTHPDLPAHRPQPPLRGHGAHHRPGPRLSRLLGPHPEVGRLPVGDPARPRVRHLRGRQVAPHARRRGPPRGLPGPLAARARLRALLRLLPRRDPPVRTRPRARQPLRRAARHLRGRLPRHRGPRRPRHRVRHRPARGRPRQAVLPLLRDRRVPLTPPGAAGVDRALPRPLRPGLGRVARGDLPPSARPGHHPARRRAVAARAVDPGMGLARPRRAAPRGAVHGVLRRVPRPRRPPDRTRRRSSSSASASSTTR